MPGFAKFLAFMNIVAAGAFIYLAAIDYNMRQVWSREHFRHQLALTGLPQDNEDPGPAVSGHEADDLTDDDDALLKSLFKMTPGAGAPVLTQAKEVERVKGLLTKELAGLDGAALRQRIGALLMAQASTWEERDAIAKEVKDPKVPTEKLQADLLGKFDNALAADAKSEKHEGGIEKQDISAKRRAIAHLLYNLDPTLESHQRLTVIIGQKAFLREAEVQAMALRDMAERTKLLTLDDRTIFELEYMRNRDRIIELAQQNAKMKIDLDNRKALSERIIKEVIDPQEARIAQLGKDLDEAKAKASAKLAEQAKTETELFGIHQEMGHLMDENRKMEQQIRDRELGRTRGGER